MAKWIKKYRWGLLFLLPEIAVFLLFLWVPIVRGIVYSFEKVDFVAGIQFVGLDNYRDILSRSEILQSVRNSLYYMVLCVLIGFWVPCLFAVIVSELRRFQGFARSLLYFPTLVPSVALYGMWLWFYDSVGPFNSFLASLGLDKIPFLTDTHWAMPSIVLMETWQQFGGAFIIYIAGMAGIPRDLYEAAEIDGAGVWQRIRHITLPGIRHLLVLMFIMQLIATSQAYQSQQAITDGGPVNATLTYGLMIIREAFTNLNYGTASAMGVLMLIVLGGLSVLYMRLDKDGVISR
ncbi:carbohydrate ABC transporter permease [Cohnella candidum]|uniref:Sugar ABC transporter permease n=1 Tax=Cohnella candidum TaxID=2674991 RepID=A0A3G3K439_9BACL|nr:sugar ABC transporter permease [Cohnella candidum]AYQ75284.1 sugar ABC transporter permease [Cohnella candidum]